MLSFRGAAAGALMLAAAAMSATAPLALAEQPAGITIVADLLLDTQGVLQVEEKVTVPEGDEFRMSLPLRLQVEPDVERRFAVTDVETTGVGSTTTADDRFTIIAPPGESTFRYSVHNTVGDAPNSQVFHWIGVVDTDIASISAALVAPSYELAIVDCTLGPPGDTRPCADVRTEAIGVLHLEQTDIRKGDAIDLTVQIPPGTVPANADVIDHNAPGPFSVSAPVLAAFGVLAAVLAALAALVWRARRENDAASTGSEVLDPLDRTDGHVRFISPEGILPGEAGLLLDEHVDPIDIAATVVDLAVRRYLWITRIAESDWRVTRVNDPDDQLRAYEQAVYRALLPDGVDAVTLREVRESGRARHDSVRATMIADSVDRGTFVDRTRPGHYLWFGGALAVVGVLATVGLAVTSGYALVGVAILLAGVAVMLLPKYLPARTALGSDIARRVRALQRGLDAIGIDQIPAADRETVFSRALPYTVASGRVDSWVRAFRSIDPSDDSQPGLYWFGGYERDRDLQRFAGDFPFFITAVEGLFHTPKV
ncbi:DUF2207 domain-containing protein [Nocardia higoensis]|uniref:DUF2207 domain-containing protein n=1 Tax=Nocardia higoensis TaxID=228599 RepID=A0ABS0DHK1_9NOCA|nr:DUF2207 domain-containing protein [Nocardia higoensis]MBF6357939.1 DUF2207 domain-containing protein [Nocardia higoensis]